jgi:hypothetical protein
VRWQLSFRADQVTREIADRHYSRQTVGAKQFVPPGRCVVLRTVDDRAYWVTSWPYPEYVKHAWPGAWMCSAFRNEGAGLSSELIREAISATRFEWAAIPDLGMVTFVDPKKVRHKRDPGRCFVKAGFTRLKQRTKAGLIVLQMLPHEMPEPEPAGHKQLELLDG